MMKLMVSRESTGANFTNGRISDLSLECLRHFSPHLQKSKAFNRRDRREMQESAEKNENIIW
jgi:hypothetical protein